MFWTIHVLVGILLGLKLNPILAIPIAFLSHFIIDMIPHWDSYFDKKNFQKTGKAEIKKKDVFIRGADGIISLAIIAVFLYNSPNIFIFLAIIASLLPDISKLGYYLGLRNAKWFKAYLKFHTKIQFDVPIFWGIITQIILALILGFAIIKII